MDFLVSDSSVLVYICRSNRMVYFSEPMDDTDEDRNFEPENVSSGTSSPNEEEGDGGGRLKQKRTRKLVRCEKKWKRKKAKILRDSGKEYIGSKGVVKPAKSVKEYEHNCRYACNTISEDERAKVFNDYWALESWDMQTAFINGCLESNVPKKSLKNTKKHKNVSICAKLYGKRVCKMFFIKTLDITVKRYDNVVKRISANKTGVSPKDKRGKHVPSNKTVETVLQKVIQHIESFPMYTSHYSRNKNPSKKYLDTHLNVQKMYSLYVDTCKVEGANPVKESFYRTVFNTKFNLSFKKPLTDTCNKCDLYESQIKHGANDDVIQEAKFLKEFHQRRADNAREAKTAAKKYSEENPDKVKAVCFDLQKTLPTPVLTCNKIYYARQLWTYNLNVHDLGTNLSYMFMWHEGEASRGSNEIGSCLLKYAEQLPPSVKHLIAFSDNCGGQNKNQFIARFWMYIVKNTHIETVDHKFLVPGHSYMECDQNFGLIEKTKKQQQYVFVPDDWVKVVTGTSRRFQVIRMDEKDFLSSEKMNENLKDSVDGISQFQWLRFKKEEPLTILFKKSLNEDLAFEKYSMVKPKVGRPQTIFTLKKLHEVPPKITTAKFKDLQTLLPFLPPIHHEFYINLKHATKEKKERKTKTENVNKSTGKKVQPNASTSAETVDPDDLDKIYDTE